MSYVQRHAGKVTKDGQLVLADPSVWRGTLARHRGRDVWVTVKRQQHQRTLPQNRYYWVIVDEVGNYIGEDRGSTHELLKQQFLPPRDIELLDGGRLKMPPTTRTLTIEEFTNYIEAIRVWASQFLGLHLPDPGEVETL